MDLDSLIPQLQTLGPWGWIVAAALVIYTTWRKKQTPATPLAPAVPAAAVITAPAFVSPAASPPTPSTTSTSVNSLGDKLLATFEATVAAAAAERQRLQAEHAKLTKVSGTPAGL